MTTPAPTRRECRRLIQRHLRSRRIRALLASGIVLGVGATATLAAWNDSEYAGGAVTAGHFTLEGSTDAVEYWSSDAGSAHILSFTPESALYPGATDYAFFSVRTTGGSLGGTVQVLADEGNTAGLGAYLTHGISQIEGTTCDEGTFDEGATVVERGTALDSGADAAQDLAANQESAVNYCLELHLPEDAPNDAQGQSASPTWEFLGTSVSE